MNAPEDALIAKAAEAVDAEWMRPEHDCDGTERDCGQRCPVPAYRRMGMDELRDAAARAVVEAVRDQIAAEALREMATKLRHAPILKREERAMHLWLNEQADELLQAPQHDHEWVYVDTISQPEVGSWSIYRCACGTEENR